jgi:uncharacterized protein
MAAGLVAFAADVDLEGLKRAAPQAQAVCAEFFGEAIHPRETIPERIVRARGFASHAGDCFNALVNPEQLIVFVKAPRVGQVKTRLAKTLGATEARDAYKQLVAAVLGSVSGIKHTELRFAPDDALAEITPWLREHWTAHPQGDGDLGARLTRAFAETFARGAERVVIIGSDCAELKSSDIRNAWRELRDHDLVVGPAIDGGYWLIGLRAPQPELFRDIAWSSDQVLGHTLQRAKSLGLRIQLLRILSDVDTQEDWERFGAKGA